MQACWSTWNDFAPKSVIYQHYSEWSWRFSQVRWQSQSSLHNGKAVRVARFRRKQSLRPGHFFSIFLRSSYTPSEKVVFPTDFSSDDVEPTPSDIQFGDQQDDASDDSEQVQECNTDSYVCEDLSNHEDVLTFLRGMRTSKSQMVRVVRPQMWTVYCVAAMSLSCGTNESTDKGSLERVAHGMK